MNVNDANAVLKEVFGPDTKVFAREDPIQNQRRVLRPLNEDEDPKDHNGRLLLGEKLVILGQGKEWRAAVEMAILPELQKRQAAAQLRAAHASHQGELFAVFLREKHSQEFETWKADSEMAKQMEAAFQERIAPTKKETAP